MPVHRPQPGPPEQCDVEPTAELTTQLLEINPRAWRRQSMEKEAVLQRRQGIYIFEIRGLHEQLPPGLAGLAQHLLELLLIQLRQWKIRGSEASCPGGDAVID